MEQIIKKAIEEGYKDRLDFISNRTFGTEEQFPMIVCDPLFWQSLGKACGWKQNYTKENPEWNTMTLGEMIQRTPIRIALKFHEINLTENWEKAIEYLTNLINKE